MLSSMQVRTLIMMLILVIPHGFNPAGDLTQRAPGSSLAGPSSLNFKMGWMGVFAFQKRFVSR